MHHVRIRLAALLFSIVGALAGVPSAQAEYQDPFHCRPPFGQGLFEIGANNMAFRYRQEPTPANKQTMCNSYRKVVAAYANAVTFCRRNTCTTAEFQDICTSKRDKLREWQQKQRAACGAAR